ncbi:MAG: hypothetical protein DMG39_21515 [Acidobacteria bacterium]|nr:MAG: hypothetical protein DMG39_21515 [Acidobacteriota bacterium]
MHAADGGAAFFGLARAFANPARRWCAERPYGFPAPMNARREEASFRVTATPIFQPIGASGAPTRAQRDPRQ